MTGPAPGGGPRRPWRIAVVGSGPSGMYATGHLVDHYEGAYATPSLVEGPDGAPVEVDLYDRLPTPWGLVRGGVAPDHATKKKITKVFDAISTHPGVRLLGNVEVGRDVGTDELASWYDAVVYAYGAGGGRVLDLPGAELPGVHTAHDVVAWYNGRPDHAGLEVDLAGERAVVLGNGNVALDVARVLALPPDALATTDIADHAHDTLRASGLREVVVVGRRGPEHAAFGVDELDELVEAPGIDVVVDAGDLPDVDTGLDGTAARKLDVLRELARTPPRGHPRRVVLRFHESPERLDGDHRLRRLHLRCNRPCCAGDGNGTDQACRAPRPPVLDASAVVFAVGYRSAALPGLPFDDEHHVLPTAHGRVTRRPGHEETVPGAYATGWIKRGPSGVIGTNKDCARETITALAADAARGRLDTAGTLDAEEVLRRLASRTDVVTWRGWRAIDRAEIRRGRAQDRPRRKLVDVDDMLDHSRR